MDTQPARDETEAFRWAAETDIRELASEAYAIRMLDALHDHGPAAVRQHDGKQLL
jgi:8-oxo-dGTP diphosphatase